MTVRRRTWFSRNLSKHVLAEAFRDYPLLRLLLFKKWFRLAVLAFVLLVVFLCLFLPKIWLATPRNFHPEVKVSGLDMLQAWSLKRAALKAMAAGQKEEADRAWQAAMANNFADPRLSRGYLQNVLDYDQTRVNLPLTIGEAFWLLRISQTNAADLDLAARVCSKFHADELTLQLLNPRAGSLTPGLRKLHAKALFNADRVAEFAKVWDANRSEWASDPEMALYEAAFQAGWGNLDKVTEANTTLEQAEHNPESQELAHRLEMIVSVHLVDPDRYKRSLDRLIQWHADTALDHVNYWQLLSQAGQRDKARDLAQAYPNPPRTANDTIKLGKEYANLGLHEQAQQVLQRYLAEFSYSEQLWQTYADLLISDQQWETLSGLALQIRQGSPVQDLLTGFSYYLEGRAQMGLDRRPLAEVSFRRAADFKFEDPTLAVYVAADVLRCGYPSVANQLAKKIEKNLSNDWFYWDLVCDIAYNMKDADQFMTAASKAYELNPELREHIMNYAAALLVFRKDPDMAVKLTQQLMIMVPDNVGNRINHSMALVMNRRIDKAEEVLKTIPIGRLRLTAPVANSYYLAQYEICLNQQRWKEARTAAAKIDTTLLFPNQIKWLAENKPPADTSGSSLQKAADSPGQMAGATQSDSRSPSGQPVSVPR